MIGRGILFKQVVKTLITHKHAYSSYTSKNIHSNILGLIIEICILKLYNLLPGNNVLSNNTQKYL